MNCPSCNFEIQNQNSKFCPHCGKSLTANPGETPVGLPKVQITKKHMRILAGLLLIAVVFGGMSMFLKPRNPKEVVDTFIKAVAKGKYETAYALLDKDVLVEHKFLSKICFERTYNKIEIQSYEIEDPDKDITGQSHVSYNVTLDISGQKEAVTFSVINKGSEDKPDWKIDPNSIVTETTIHTIPGAELSVAGKRMTFDDEITSIMMFKSPKELRFDFSVHGGESISQKARPGETITANEFRPDQETMRIAQNIINNYYKCLASALKNKSIDGFENVVKKSSEEWKDISEFIKDLKKEQMVITRFDTGTVNILEAQFADKDHLVLSIEVDIDLACTDEDGNVQSEKDVANRIVVLERVYGDVPWLIIGERLAH